MSDEQTTHTIPESGQLLEETHWTACLVVIRGIGTGNKILLSKDTVSIGRADDADVRLAKAGVSRRHAQVQRLADEVFQIEDLGSTNGTYVNSTRVQQALLKDQDIIAVGENRLKFIAADSPEQPYYEELYCQAQLDKALQVYNKHYFLTRLDEDLRRHRAMAAPIALVMLDVDHFKILNDSHGHLAGDAALVHLVGLVRSRIRDTDVLCRYGGEEFGLIMAQTSVQQAQLVAEQLRALIEHSPLRHAEKTIPFTISVGISGQCRTEPPLTREALIEQADKALYHAKHAGRNRVAVYEPGMAVG